MFTRPRRHAAAPSRQAEIDAAVRRLFTLVADGLELATDAFLANDRDAANSLVKTDQVIDRLQNGVEDLIDEQLVCRETLGDADVRLLVAVLRIVPELERSGDLVEHIALRTGPGITRCLSPKARGIIAEMGARAVSMWRLAAVAYDERDETAAELLRVADDELDDLHVRLTAELAAEPLPTSVAIELGLVARFFERLGDHAVNVTRRLVRLSEPTDPTVLQGRGANR